MPLNNTFTSLYINKTVKLKLNFDSFLVGKTKLVSNYILKVLKFQSFSKTKISTHSKPCACMLHDGNGSLLHERHFCTRTLFHEWTFLHSVTFAQSMHLKRYTLAYFSTTFFLIVLVFPCTFKIYIVHIVM